MDLLKNHWIFAAVAALLAASLSWAYERTLTKEPTQLKKTFFKTLLVTSVALFGLSYFVNRPEPVMQEPFHAS